MEQNFQRVEENEEERAVGDLLRSLGRAEAPADFDLKLRKGILAARPAARSGWMPIPAYAAGLAAVLVAGSVFVLTEYFPSPVGPVDVASGSKASNIAAAATPLISATPKPDIAVSNDVRTPLITAPDTPNFAPAVNRTVKPDREPSGGSRDLAVGNAQPIYPRGLNPVRSSGNTSTVVESPQLSLDAVLGPLGIDSRFEGQQLRIIAVKPGSIADKCGIAADDVLTAIDATKITPSTQLGTRVNVKTLMVTRSGQRIQIEIRAQ